MYLEHAHRYKIYVDLPFCNHVQTFGDKLEKAKVKLFMDDMNY